MNKRLQSGPARWRNVLLCATAAAFTFAFSAQAQPAGSKTASGATVVEGGYSSWDVSPYVGWQWFQAYQGTTNSVHKYESAATFGERVTEDFAPHFALEESLGIGYNRLDLRPFGNPGFASVGARNVQIAVDFVYHLTPRTAKYRPFILAGPGYIWYIPAGGFQQPPTGVAILPASMQIKNRPTFTYGVGLKANMNRYIGVRFDVRGIMSKVGHYNLPDLPGAPGSLYIARGGNESALMATLGITLRMGYHDAILKPPPDVNLPVAVNMGQSATATAAITGARNVCAGDDLRLAVNATGFGNITGYQWMVNGQPAAGGTGANFSVPTTAGGARNITAAITQGPVTVTSAPVSVATEPAGKYHLTANVTGTRAGQTLSYQWLVNGQPASGATSSSFDVPVESTAATKSVSVTVTATSAPVTTAVANLTVNPLTPPTIRFAVNPATVPYTNGPINLAAVATPSQCGGATTVRYSGEGVTGTTFNPSTVSGFDMSNRLKQQSKVVTLTATATDAKNQTATATAPVTVTLGTQATRLDDIVFPKLSARCNNCAKRILLDTLTPMLRNDPGAKVILIGHRDEQEKGSKAALALDQTRVVNAAAVLSAGKGICPSLDTSRILVNWVGTDQTTATRPGMCGSSTDVKEKAGQAVKESDKRAEFRRVEIWFVPSGAANPQGIGTLKEFPAAAVTKAGCPK